MRTLSAAVVLLLAGCGPSYQAIYEGDARFEHCYALDENPSRGVQDKAECWRGWQERYTYGQTRDRVEYAALRYRALSRLPELPTDEAMMQAAPGETPGKRPSVNAAPMPTSAYAPPPRTLADGLSSSKVQPKATWGATPDPPPTAAPPPPPPPNASCSEQCTTSWRACKDKPDACEKGYRKCMSVCFK